MKSLIIVSIEFKPSNCESKGVRITDHRLDRLSVDPIRFLSVGAVQKANSGEPGPAAWRRADGRRAVDPISPA